MQLYLTANISVHFNNSGGIPMIIDSAKLNGPCSCGRSHEMITKEAIIEPGCLKKLDFYTDKYGITGKRAVIYDENTYHAKNILHPAADQEIILDHEFTCQRNRSGKGYGTAGR